LFMFILSFSISKYSALERILGRWVTSPIA
jgi:hypothetical protein